MNKNKKRLLIVLALVLAAALAAGITIAWFTDSETVTNVATMGAVDVDLTEEVEDPDVVTDKTENPDFDDTKDPSPTNPENFVPDPENPERNNPLVPGTPTDDGAEYTDTIPGTSFIKAPTVENLEEDALIRLVVTRSWENVASGTTANIDYIILHLVNTTDWTHAVVDDVDYFYYSKILEKPVSGTSSETSAPFDYFSISTDVDNGYANATAKIDIKVEAVQAAGLGVTDAKDVSADVWASVTPAPAPSPAP